VSFTKRNVRVKFCLKPTPGPQSWMEVGKIQKLRKNGQKICSSQLSHERQVVSKKFEKQNILLVSFPKT